MQVKITEGSVADTLGHFSERGGGTPGSGEAKQASKLRVTRGDAAVSSAKKSRGLRNRATLS